MGEKRALEQCEDPGFEFDLKRVKTEPVEYVADDCTKRLLNAPSVGDSVFDFDNVKQEKFSWESDIWSNVETRYLNYHNFDNCYGYGNIYSSEYHQPFYRSYTNMADVISFDSQDFLLQSDIDLLQSIEFEFPLQEASDIPTEVTQIEIITSPTKRKRGSGNKKTQSSGGNGTKKTSSTQYTTVPLPPCKVCGGVATGFHFGVITCEACKVCRCICLFRFLNLIV